MTFARSTPLIAADTPLADRLPTADEIGAQCIADIRDMMLDVGAAYQAIYGFRDEDFARGPDHPHLTTVSIDEGNKL